MDTHTAQGNSRTHREAPRIGLLTEYDLHLLGEGSHLESYRKLGAHPLAAGTGAGFGVWAPNATYVSVIGDFNGWDRKASPLRSSDAGVWHGVVDAASVGTRYKYYIENRHTGFQGEKADPYAFAAELRPNTASIVHDIFGYQWSDHAWMEQRPRRNILEEPLLVYELHLGSWKQRDGRWLTYRELADELPAYIHEMGFTHVELLPITEHPYDASWGYQTTGYFAPTSRFGSPEDFKHLVERFHEYGIGVILDWVPAHFPTDAHGLAYFDGTHLYEHADPRQGAHPDWGTYVFNFGRREVANFLLSSALFWLKEYHIDALRVDAVASMLYLDYSRKEGEWIPNRFGGRENLEAIDFLRRFNLLSYQEAAGSFTAAEESTAWPMVSRPTYTGGLGFGFKWNMGWMNDTLRYMRNDPVHRCYHHSELTFGLLYAFTENFILPLSHDEVVHGKGSLLSQMPGDTWQKFANLRLLFGHMYAHPGKKLLFMGAELGDWDEWNYARGLHWHLLDYPLHRGMQRWVRDLNLTVRAHPALYAADTVPEGFEWIDCTDHAQSVISSIRRSPKHNDTILVVSNFTPVVRSNYRIGVPCGGRWTELLNSDKDIYGGSGQGNGDSVLAEERGSHGRPHSLVLNLPPLGTLLFKPEGYF
ncbi:MAG: 1,4-alpha-glucan branching protein GlgB [Bdellovibrionales bacterium]|nr:1,4-alpha-glucan branching protein GlgB [Bdellovibrionales bacterium]